MLSRNGIVKVMDFGIAKVMGTRGLTRTGTQMGTAFYMSPEQVLNKAVDIRSDIYSLGVTLYEMLSAHVPFEAESDYQIMASHVSAAPPLPTRFYPYIAKGVENAVLKAMEKNPDARFQTVEEFGEALEHPEDYVVPVGAVAASPGPTVGAVAPAVAVAAGTGRTIVEAGTRLTPAPVPESGAAALESPMAPLPTPVEAPVWVSFLRSRNGLLAVAGAAVVLVGVVLFAARHKVIPSGPPSNRGTATVKNTGASGGTTNQGQSFVPDHIIANATQTKAEGTQKGQEGARKAPLKPTSQTQPENTATGTSGSVESVQVTTVPAGTTVTVRTIDEIDPQRSVQGQKFHASFDSPVFVGDEVAIPKGADALVQLAGASSAGHFTGRSSLTLKLVQVTVQGHKYAVSSDPCVVQGSSRGKRSTEVIGGAAAVGAAIGGIFGHKKKKDALVGGAAGAGAGAAAQGATNPQEVTLESETVIQFVLNRPLALPQSQ
jgi:hypothetical protein